MISLFRRLIPERSPIRLTYHKFSAMLAAIWYRFPAHQLRVIGVTGTSGKSTTVELIWYLLQQSGKNTGALSTIQFHFGPEQADNVSLRTTLRPWKTQKYIRRMVRMGCTHLVLEVSSHALDQHRTWGIAIDTAVLTNIANNEHLDYHKTFADYVRTKTKLFSSLNTSYRKANLPKTSVINRDDKKFEIFDEFPADKKWTYSVQKPSDIMAQDVEYTARGMSFTLRVPNNQARITAPLVGRHNLENLLAAITVAMSHGVSLEQIKTSLAVLPGVPTRLEPIEMGQPFSVIVDFTYKPPALRAVLETLKNIIPGRLIVVWGGVGTRDPDFWREAGSILHKYADEIILTTDDPYDTDPRQIAAVVREQIPRAEGEGFFEIEDRYEAIRYGIMTAEPQDTVLVAGRGQEKVQTIGKQKIPFDDREVCREILQFVRQQQSEERHKHDGMQGE